MKYLITALAFTLVLFSCQKEIENSGTGAGGGSGSGGSGGGGTTTVTLGVQKQLFASIRHDFLDILDANNNRIMFMVRNNTLSVDEFYAGDNKDSVYQLSYYDNPNSFNYYTTTLSLKPNGDIACIYRKANASGPDSIITLINKPATTTWQLIKRELGGTPFWNIYTYASTELFMQSTSTGRLVLTGAANTKVAVSDDNGLTWRQTFTLPSTFLNTSRSGKISYSGTRNFISSGNMILYSDDNFETGTLVIVSPFGDIKSKILKLDSKLVLKYSPTQRDIYQSVNNGQSWTLMPLFDPIDTLSQFSNSYFCHVSGDKIRLRAMYQRCNSYYTVDINPTSKFAFYPLTPVPVCPLPSAADDYLASCQREDKRMYYALSYFNGSNTFCVISRDY